MATIRDKYTRTHPLPEVHLLEPTDENIHRTLTIVGKAFIAAPLFVTFVIENDNLTPSHPRNTITRARVQEYYTAGLTAVIKAGAILLESGDFAAFAVWESPGFKGVDFSSSRKKYTPASAEWTRRMKAARVRYLGVEEEGANPPLEEITELTEIRLRPFWHLGFIARDPDVSGVPGVVSALMVPYLARAREEGVPAWLEATTEYGVRMYEFFGFRLVETVTIGVGRYGADGWFEEGGVGSSAYCMIYDGHMPDRKI